MKPFVITGVVIFIIAISFTLIKVTNFNDKPNETSSGVKAMNANSMNTDKNDIRKVYTDKFTGEGIQVMVVDGNDLNKNDDAEKIRISKPNEFYLVEVKRSEVYKKYAGENGKYKADIVV